MEIHPDWAPLGAARILEMANDDFFKGIRFFRVINGFMAQFGIHGKPEIAAVWREKRMVCRCCFLRFRFWNVWFDVGSRWLHENIDASWDDMLISYIDELFLFFFFCFDFLLGVLLFELLGRRSR